MSLTKEFFSRKTNISAKVIADSINETGQRLTTFELEFPRLILSECNTHGAIEKNTSSSRAIPVSKMLDHLLEQNLKPVYFGSKKKGMQAGDELNGTSLEVAKGLWEDSLEKAVFYANQMDTLGVAKEVSNRVTEPYQLIKAVWSATDWDNWFNLRLHPDADPNICMLAYKMYRAMQESKPNLLKNGEYHLPYVKTLYDGYTSWLSTDDTVEKELKLEEAIKYSVASCASVSYRTEGMTLEKAEKIWDMLIKAEVVHASPFTHVATPISTMSSSWYESNKDWADFSEGSVNIPEIPSTWQKGITHMRKDGTLCSGRFAGFIQYRHLIDNNTCWSFDFEERIKLFE